MDIKNFILWLALLSTFLSSGNGYAIPLLMDLAPSGDAKDRDVRFISVVNADKSDPETDEMQAFVHVMRWNFESSSIGALLGYYYGPFDFLHGFSPPFGFSAQDGGLEKLITSANFDPHNDVVISGNFVGFEDDTAIAEFFATLGFDIVDWHPIMENSHVPSQHEAAPIPDGPAVHRPTQRKECSQQLREFSKKSELHDNDCFNAGGLAGFNSNAGRSRISAIANSSHANPNLRNNPGGAGGGGIGGGSGGTSPGAAVGGDDDGRGSGGAPDTGSTPGTGMGDGEIGGGGSEIHPLPEPATSVLVLFGVACMYYKRSHSHRGIVLKGLL